MGFVPPASPCLVFNAVRPSDSPNPLTGWSPTVSGSKALGASCGRHRRELWLPYRGCAKRWAPKMLTKLWEGNQATGTVSRSKSEQPCEFCSRNFQPSIEFDWTNSWKPADLDRYDINTWHEGEFCHAPGGHQSHSPRCRRYGAYLLRDTKRVTRIVGTLASSLRVPVTAAWPASRVGRIEARQNTAKKIHISKHTFTCIGRIKDRSICKYVLILLQFI